MQPLDKRLENIEVKVRQLLHHNKELNEENKRLKEDLSQYLKESSINNKDNVRPPKEVNADFSSQIDQYISEIDECIELVKTLN